MSHRKSEEDLAYGEYHGQDHGQQQESDRGLIGDTFRKFTGRKDEGQGGFNTDTNQNDPPKKDLFDSIWKIGADVVGKINSHLDDKNPEGQASQASQASQPTPAVQAAQITDDGDGAMNRYGSFAGQRNNNDIKWFVDGCGYFYAMSVALQNAKESIWILDWWLSPELYLRRPPAKHESYRLDRILKAAAERGVKINIIVYKEVTQALTRKYLRKLAPRHLLPLLPSSTDRFTSLLVRLGLAATLSSLEHIEANDPLIAPPVTVSSSHTKHWLENLHANIAVFRHPDHLPDADNVGSDLIQSLKSLSLDAAGMTKLSSQALKNVYGFSDDVVLYWAHHEKLCLIDGSIAFMGGLDACFGRWDTNQHSIADTHPTDLNEIVFPGQDYNNARIADFNDVAHPDQNKVNRKISSRMGWSDISVCLHGPVVDDLKYHFVNRWNYIFEEKYGVRRDQRYSKLDLTGFVPGKATAGGAATQQPPAYGQHRPQQTYEKTDENYPPPPPGPPPGQGEYGYDRPDPQYQAYHPPPQDEYGQSQSQGYQPYHPSEESGRGFEGEESERGFGLGGEHHHRFRDEFSGLGHRIKDRYLGGQSGQHGSQLPAFHGGISCQIVRSCTKWSNGTPTEHSIQNAYIEIIKNSKHFCYFENQFWITATGDKQDPIKNLVGQAIVERILRAARAGEKYKIIVIVPAIPGFAGDLKDDAALGTRAIMEFQYASINRGHGNSIMELIKAAGYNPLDYIRFYNLRNYDRINMSAEMRRAEMQSGVDYESARREQDDRMGAGFGGYGEGTESQEGRRHRYQDAADKGDGVPDSVASCYMLGGKDIRDVPWSQPGDESELDAFVNEELYVHSKVLVADDRIVICGSANMNDRSQLGTHDSEIAIIVEDPTPVQTTMNNQPYTASRFAASLRRQLFRKHLGLLPPQDPEKPDDNFMPIGVPNTYDWDSAEDRIVADPLAPQFENLWNSRAKTNTMVFRKVFHAVPDDTVRTWDDYAEFYEKYFKGAGPLAAGTETEDDKKKEEKDKNAPLVQWGHVVKQEFSPGEAGLREVKEELAKVKGTLVEMPLMFLCDEDVAKTGLSLNKMTEEVYT